MIFLQKVIVFELRLGLEHLGPLPESVLVIYPTRAKYNEHPSWDPHAHSDLSRRPSGSWTPPRARLLRSIHQLAQLGQPAVFELAAGCLLSTCRPPPLASACSSERPVHIR